jgi:hypothetical protein
MRHHTIFWLTQSPMNAGTHRMEAWYGRTITRLWQRDWDNLRLISASWQPLLMNWWRNYRCESWFFGTAVVHNSALIYGNLRDNSAERIKNWEEPYRDVIIVRRKEVQFMSGIITRDLYRWRATRAEPKIHVRSSSCDLPMHSMIAWWRRQVRTKSFESTTVLAEFIWLKSVGHCSDTA